MTNQTHRVAPSAAVGLFGLGLALLGVGRFVQLNDNSGFGGEEWIMPLGVLALLAALASLVVAAQDSRARLWLGAVLAALVALLVWQTTTNPGFRFIWAGSEGELVMLQVGLGLLALVLLATGFQPRSSREVGRAGRGSGAGGAGRWMVRGAVSLCCCALITYVAAMAGIAHFEAVECTDPDEMCELAGLQGLVWGVIALPASLVVALVIELVLRRRRRQRVS
ncbi:hypothetical protein [Kribbella sp. VKM Ac-2568]|uniref:hypothetical protein n=1 Tax=Kribbella sp. VKM Ac-2568 TaxID=2512219 RepID=UPI0010479B8F|nr:hypothetical protein [Kribbella sp. VKM Ac-2568]TCM42653.1 hypothetical protein EV648_110186 [Kribbella sp. VKM Ac-2568]